VLLVAYAVPPVALLPLAAAILPVAVVVPPVALLPLAVVVPPVAIIVPPVTLLPLAVAVPPVIVPSTRGQEEGSATSGRQEMMMQQPAGATRQGVVARQDNKTTRGRRVERQRNNGRRWVFAFDGDDGWQLWHRWTIEMAFNGGGAFNGV